MNQFKQIREEIDQLELLFSRVDQIKIQAKEDGVSEEQILNILDCVYTYAESYRKNRTENLLGSIFFDLKKHCQYSEEEESEKYIENN